MLQEISFSRIRRIELMSERPLKASRTEGVSSAAESIEKANFAAGPFSILDGAVRDGYQVFIQCRNNKSLMGTVVAYDKHFNVVLRDVVELSGNDGGDRAERHIKNMFLRGESVIFVVKLPPKE